MPPALLSVRCMSSPQCGYLNVHQSVSVLAAVHWLETIRLHRTSVFLCCRVLDSIKDNLRKEQSTVMEFNFLTMNKILSPIQVRQPQADLCRVLKLVPRHVPSCARSTLARATIV